MDDLQEQLLGKLRRQRGNSILGRGVRGVAIHPETYHRLLAEPDDFYYDYGRLNGYDVLQTCNVEQGDLRVVPNGGLSYPQGPHGFPAVWPSPSVTDVQGSYTLQEWPMGLTDDEVYVVDGPGVGQRVQMAERQQIFKYREVASAALHYKPGGATTYTYEKQYGAPIISLATQRVKL